MTIQWGSSDINCFPFEKKYVKQGNKLLKMYGHIIIHESYRKYMLNNTCDISVFNSEFIEL